MSDLVPIRIQVGDLELREVYRVSIKSITANPDAVLAFALREVADEIERQNREETRARQR